MPPTMTPEQQIAKLWQAIGQLEANQTQMANHINSWVAKIQGIDSVAFAALALHEGKEFKLDEEGVARIQADIQQVIEEMGRYRDEAAEKGAAKIAAEQAKKKKSTGLVVPRRPKNGSIFVPKGANKKDESNGANDNQKTN